ncbi:MAG TPA: DUF2079 domain-containing protein, partial [Chloroflexota bacterium]
MPLASCLYALFTGSLATLRHINLQTNAFDLGYVSQAVWYEAHGEPFRFTTVQGVSALLEGVAPATIRHPHWLLAFHVEPALLLLAPLYRLWPDPRLLLWLQAAAIAVGAFPAGWLGARLTGSRVAGLAFAAAWLLAPGLEGAALSDFHMVAFGATLLMAGLCLFEKARPRWALVCLALAALTREDAAATVACVALVLTINCHSERSEESWSDARNWPRTKIPRRLRLLGMRCGTRTPLLLALASALWAALAIGVIEPFFSGGVSVFGARDAWLLHDPLEVPAGDVLAYLALQLLTAGIVGLLA